MKSEFTETVLRGGSLNRTTLRDYGEGGRIVRKSISRTSEREYGFVRWYSQFKRLQRYNAILPGLFPQILDVGVEGGEAFFELEFVEGSLNVKELLTSEVGEGELTGLVGLIFSAAAKMHDYQEFSGYAHSLQLYFAEEVVQRLRDAMAFTPFREFCENCEIIIGGHPCRSLIGNLEWLGQTIAKLRSPRECFTHGNMTLENILYVPEGGRIIFVDPYDENVVDCREAEFSQVLQCCSSHYGIVNDGKVVIEQAAVSFDGSIPGAVSTFDDLFTRGLEERLPPEALHLTRVLEASQFVRMLPFKVAAGQVDKAKYFYGVASRLVDRLRTGADRS